MQYKIRASTYLPFQKEAILMPIVLRPWVAYVEGFELRLEHFIKWGIDAKTI